MITIILIHLSLCYCQLYWDSFSSAFCEIDPLIGATFFLRFLLFSRLYLPAKGAQNFFHKLLNIFISFSQPWNFRLTNDFQGVGRLPPLSMLGLAPVRSCSDYGYNFSLPFISSSIFDPGKTFQVLLGRDYKTVAATSRPHTLSHANNTLSESVSSDVLEPVGFQYAVAEELLAVFYGEHNYTREVNFYQETGLIHF